METLVLTGYDAGATLYAFPPDKSLGDWLTFRVAMTEGTGDDAGSYTASVDPAVSLQWLVFDGTGQPASLDDALVGVLFQLAQAVVISLPSTGDPQAIELGDDLDQVITAVTSAASNLLVTIRRCPSNRDADIAITKADGLVIVVGAESVSADDGAVTWGSELVTVHLAAAAFAHFRPGTYGLTLEEITTDGRRLHKHGRELMMYRTAGGLRVSA